MRAWPIAVVLAAVASTASAQSPLRIDDPEIVRKDLKSVEIAGPRQRETRNYDGDGHVTRDEVHAGKVVVTTAYTWDAHGHLASTEYRDQTGRVEHRDYTYKLDANGRIVERDMRDPKAPAGELVRETWTWAADGTRQVFRERVYAHEGPYHDGGESYDAAGRLTASSSIGSQTSELYEYDAHGGISRIRMQGGHAEHWYRVYERTYDPAGHLATEKQGNRESSFTWNARGDVTEQVSRDDGKLVERTTYTYVYR